MLSGSYLPEVKWDHVITDEDWFHVSCLNLTELPSTNKLFYNNYLNKIELIEYSYKAIIITVMNVATYIILVYSY